MKNVKIVVAGSCGKMGSEAIAMIEQNEQFELVAAIDYKHGGEMLSDLPGFRQISRVPLYADAESCFSEIDADVLVDFTTPTAGVQNTEIALEYGVRPVVGTTGFSTEAIARIARLSEQKKVGCIIAPNFAIGAILMMQFSKMAAKYFPDIEIIELHHDQKLDAPSGTALKTAEMIATERKSKRQGAENEKELLAGARGAEYDGMHIHSVRLPGLVAHQQVILGGLGENLTIRHDSFHRSSFMTGVKLAIESVMELNHFVYGLENLLG